ncbi:MAG: glycosyltransferase family 9 protein [Prevotella sp.]|nr:glycosyltransferase family 9 protein [Prevotella sp.]
MKHDHILIIRFSALGDVAMTVPVVWSLAQQYPHLRITMLSRPFARPLFDHLAPNVNFMEADLKTEYHGIKGLNRLYRRLVAKQFTHIADLHNVLRSDFLRMRFNLACYRVEHIDKNRRQRRALTKHNNKQLEPLPTSFDNYLQVFSDLGFPVKLTFRSIFGDGKGSLMQLPPIFDTKEDDEQWIGIAPFAAHEGKVYPPDQMLQVIRQLAEQHPKARLLLFGRGPREEELFPHWCHEVPQCINVGLYAETLHDELILMSHLDVMLSMDSANMHLASLTATPVVSVWGATHPYAGFMGYGQPDENIVQLDMPCRPCSIFGQKPCQRGDYACLHDIKPETIVERINHIISPLNS